MLLTLLRGPGQSGMVKYEELKLKLSSKLFQLVGDAKFCVSANKRQQSVVYLMHRRGLCSGCSAFWSLEATVRLELNIIPMQEAGENVYGSAVK